MSFDGPRDHERKPVLAATKQASVPYTASHVANYFLRRAKAERRRITHLQLQKLVYIAYGWCWEILGHQLFRDRIEAWKYGPVIPNLYHEFKHCGWKPIRQWSAHYDFDERHFLIMEVQPDGRVAGVLHRVWEAYKEFSGRQLRDMTHNPGTPWCQTYKSGRDIPTPDDLIIPDDLIRQHFAQKHRRYKEIARQHRARQ